MMTHDEPAPAAHELKYIPGTRGLAKFGIRDGEAAWYCSCGRWHIYRNPRTGSPFEATAKKKHRAHVKDVESR